jgi:hypothetical protein
MSALPELIAMPLVVKALGFCSSRPAVAALKRHGVAVIKLSPMRHVVRRDDLDRMLASAK